MNETNAIQAMVDGWALMGQKERSTSQLTLGGLIAALEEMAPERMVVGFGRPDSYRGYYVDLAFEPVERAQSVESLLDSCRALMGRTLQGYKGGDYVMGESTPVWLSNYGEASGLRLMGLASGEIISPMLEAESDS